jgi:hypothetical protein
MDKIMLLKCWELDSSKEELWEVNAAHIERSLWGKASDVSFVVVDCWVQGLSAGGQSLLRRKVYLTGSHCCKGWPG